MPQLLAIVELGGYPNLIPLYRKLGFSVEVVNSQRKARGLLKKSLPDVIVAEYIFQSDFRDRTSNLETLMAVLQRHPVPEAPVDVDVQRLQVQPQLAALMGRCHAFVLPSFYEGLPLVLAEARACGCRLVATALSGVVSQLAPPLGEDLLLRARVDGDPLVDIALLRDREKILAVYKGGQIATRLPF